MRPSITLGVRASTLRGPHRCLYIDIVSGQWGPVKGCFNQGAGQDNGLEGRPLEIDGKQCMIWGWKGNRSMEERGCGDPQDAELAIVACHTEERTEVALRMALALG